MVRALIFDVGGTLIHPARPVGETYAEFAAAHGAQLSAGEAESAFRQAFKSCTAAAPKAAPRSSRKEATTQPRRSRTRAR